MGIGLEKAIPLNLRSFFNVSIDLPIVLTILNVTKCRLLVCEALSTLQLINVALCWTCSILWSIRLRIKFSGGVFEWGGPFRSDGAREVWHTVPWPSQVEAQAPGPYFRLTYSSKFLARIIPQSAAFFASLFLDPEGKPTCESHFYFHCKEKGIDRCWRPKAVLLRSQPWKARSVPATVFIRNSVKTKELQNITILIRRGRDFNRSNFRTKFGPSVRSLAESRFRRNVCPLTDDTNGNEMQT